MEVIRTGGSTMPSGLPEPEDAPVITPVKARRGKIFKARLPSFDYWRTRATVGVDIGYNALRLVKIKADANGEKRLIDYELVPFPPGVTKGSKEAADLLSASLSAFCDSAVKVDIWTSLSAANVDVRCLFIPRVPDKQIPNAIYWNAKQEGMSLDEREHIFDYEVHEEIYDQLAPKLSVMVYTALRSEVEEIKRFFSQCGWPLAGVTIIPFAIQNLLRTKWLKADADTIASLFVGNDFSRIDIYSRGNLVLTRGIKAGTRSLVESFIEGYNEKRTPPSEDPTGPAPLPLDPEAARNILANLYAGHKLMTGIPADYDLKEEDVLSLILPALNRLTRQVERTFDHYASIAGQSRVQRLLYSSVIGAHEPLLHYMNEQLGVEVSLLDPPLARPDKMDFDEVGVIERVSYTAAIGLALSANDHTPNMLFTFKDKIERVSVARINKLIFISFISLVMVCTVIFIYLGKTVAESKASLHKLEREFSLLQPPVDKTIISKHVAELEVKNRQIMVYGDRHLGLATVAELTALTPPEVALISVVASFPDHASGPEKVETKTPPVAPEKPETKIASGQGNIALEGIIASAKKSPEVILAEYALRLDKSPLFSQAAIQKSTLETVGGKKILHFTVQVKFE